MIQADPRVQIVVVVDPEGPGGAERFAAPFADSSVLGHTLKRLSRCRRISGICLVHPPGFALPEIPKELETDGSPELRVLDALVPERGSARRRAARKWAPTCWRGGLGGATCFDEVLFPAAALAALDSSQGSAALLVGGDWPLVDPKLCDALVERHLRDPQHLPLVFSQAAPGWCGCLVSRDLLTDLGEKQAMIGTLLDYQPQVPQGDPIAKDPCVQVEASARRAEVRAIYDAPRWQALLRQVEAARDSASLLNVGAAELGATWPQEMASSRLPQQVTLELSPRRL
ncbi:MAG: hypothetical protein OER86_01540, partial [Phycisphaerae bacterium]|nr:hypothetical protein [Phycisphaerae bacterium]